MHKSALISTQQELDAGPSRMILSSGSGAGSPWDYRRITVPLGS